MSSIDSSSPASVPLRCASVRTRCRLRLLRISLAQCPMARRVFAAALSSTREIYIIVYILKNILKIILKILYTENWVNAFVLAFAQK
jgi:hypothetical protein